MIALPVFATPDRSITVEEDWLGSNENGFVILRTETDNHGSYCSGQVTRYLDEYEKAPQKQPIESSIARRAKRTTLLDIRTNRDYSAGPPITTEDIKTRDQEVKLADVLRKYPGRTRKWNAEKFAKFAAWKKKDHDIRSGQNQVMSRYEVVNEVFGLESGQGLIWTLETVMEDGNCLYLRMTTGLDEEEEEGSSQSRWICILPEKTLQIRDHLELQPFYLCIGHYDTAEEAVKQARELMKKTTQTKDSIPGLEVWSVSDYPEPCYFTIVLKHGMGNMNASRFEKLKSHFGQGLTPVSSEYFKAKNRTALE